MSKDRCFLCHKSSGQRIQKLFNGCEHESACLECLRDKYIILRPHQHQHQHQHHHYQSHYPLKCFHPDCQRVLQDAQIKRIAQSKNELQTFRSLNVICKYNRTICKNNRTRFGEHWRDLLQVAQAMKGMEVCRCPSCSFVIVKNGGCDHMTCFCGTEFSWAKVCNGKESQTIFPILFKKNLVLPPAAAAAKKNRTTIPVRLDDDAEDGYFRNGMMPFDDVEDEIDIDPPNSTEYHQIGAEQEACHNDDEPSATQPSREAPLPSRLLNGDVKNADWEHDDYCIILEHDDEFSAEDNSWDTLLGGNSSSHHTAASQSSSWEEVSEVSSVQSFHSKMGMSFLEVARSNKSSTWPNQEEKEPLRTISEPSLAPRRMKPKRIMSQQKEQEEYDCLTFFDADFFFEGAKGGRGGKAKFRFHNEIPRRYRRRDQHQRSSVRDYDYNWYNRGVRPKYIK
ncbi:unnamed protein product [Cylindrotheca closterium]|uniref:Uncharacterized protein n=1 Tax=Cylindrotheca closterium TaxID=2856 RepID=A0AAD2CLQ7_9STRA|nr:unnamed protein product [Cylindrotheca closterium]